MADAEMLRERVFYHLAACREVPASKVAEARRSLIRTPVSANETAFKLRLQNHVAAALCLVNPSMVSSAESLVNECFSKAESGLPKTLPPAEPSRGGGKMSSKSSKKGRKRKRALVVTPEVAPKTITLELVRSKLDLYRRVFSSEQRDAFDKELQYGRRFDETYSDLADRADSIAEKITPGASRFHALQVESSKSSIMQERSTMTSNGDAYLRAATEAFLTSRIQKLKMVSTHRRLAKKLESRSIEIDSLSGLELRRSRKVSTKAKLVKLQAQAKLIGEKRRAEFDREMYLQASKETYARLSRGVAEAENELDRYKNARMRQLLRYDRSNGEGAKLKHLAESEKAAEEAYALVDANTVPKKARSTALSRNAASASVVKVESQDLKVRV